MKADSREKSSRPVAIWLLIGVGMIMIQVLLGGITRLTGSGLSITEWQPLLGTLPPMNEAEWQVAFDKYKAIGQFKQLNFDFNLQDFKTIFFWEWFHRNWARFMALVFAVPFAYFLINRYFKKNMIQPMLLLFLLGGLQGAIGWIMVKSGLNEENIYVSHIRLAIHFIAALGLLCYVLWFALKLIVPADQVIVSRSLKTITTRILILLVIQLIYGAFMAGLKAGPSAPTWPTINGQWWPSNITNDWVSNPINVHFIHRALAYTLTISLIYWWWQARKIHGGSLFRIYRPLPLLVVALQVILGIFATLYSPWPGTLLWIGVAHQFTAMLLLILLTIEAFLIRSRSFQQA